MSHSTTDCLSHAIGLSRTNCECFDSDKPLRFNESDSGLYLDELEGLTLNMIDSINDCEAGSLWDIMDKARENAIITFKADLMAASSMDYKPKRQPFSGIIGDAKTKTNLSLTSTKAGTRIYCANIISGVMKLKRIGLLMSGAGTYTINVYNDYSTTPIATYTNVITTTVNTLTWYTIPTPLELPMNHEYGYNPNYYIIYEMVGSIQPKDVKASCGCNSSMYKYYFDIKNPLFKSYEKERWSEFIMISGVSGNDISIRDEWGTEQYLNGMLLDAEFYCKTTDLICKQNFNYEANSLALATAYALRYRAGAYVIDSILSSGQINRFTMMEREQLYGKKNSYTSEYFKRISYISQEMNYNANDCLVCNNYDDLVKVGIFS